jgi:hypothetical protein
MNFRIRLAIQCSVLGVFLLACTPSYGQTVVPVTVRFSATGYSAPEGTGGGTSNIEVTIQLTGAPAGDVSVSYRVDATQVSTATKDVDYVGTSVVGTVTFSQATNETEKKFNVQVYKDDVPEPDETIQLELYNPTGGAVLGTPAKTTVTILNDDNGPPPVITSITATVRSTPPNTAGPRLAGAVSNAWPAPIDRTFRSIQTIQENTNGTLAFGQFLFDAPNAVVLFQGGDDVTLTVTATDLGTRNVTFAVVRAPDDQASIGGAADLPTVTRTAATTATLQTDQKGSFQVLAFIDQNGNNRWDTTEKGITLPYILIRAEATFGAAGDRSLCRPAGLDARFQPNAGAATAQSVQTVTGGVTAATAAVYFDGDVTLLGGGINGTRGVDRAFFEWNNNLTAQTYRGDYPADGAMGTARRMDAIFVTNTPNPRFLFNGTAPAPLPNAAGLSLPLLDTSRPLAFGASRDGGMDIMLTIDPAANGMGTVIPTETLGQMRTLTALDSPQGAFFLAPPPALPGALPLATIQYNLDFRCRLMGWTNSTGGASPTPATANSVGFRTFSHVRFNDWTVRGSWTITAPGAGWTRTAGVGNTITMTKDFNGPPALRTSLSAAETRPPTPNESALLFFQ